MPNDTHTPIEELAIALLWQSDLACGLALNRKNGLPDDADYSRDFLSHEAAVLYFDTVKASLDRPPWADGQHCGDCSQVAMTCNRCLLESWMAEAEQEVVKYA